MMSTEAIFYEPVDPPEVDRTHVLGDIAFADLVQTLRHHGMTVDVEMDHHGHGHFTTEVPGIYRDLEVVRWYRGQREPRL